MTQDLIHGALNVSAGNELDVQNYPTEALQHGDSTVSFLILHVLHIFNEFCKAHDPLQFPSADANRGAGSLSSIGGAYLNTAPPTIPPPSYSDCVNSVNTIRSQNTDNAGQPTFASYTYPGVVQEPFPMLNFGSSPANTFSNTPGYNFVANSPSYSAFTPSNVMGSTSILGGTAPSYVSSPIELGYASTYHNPNIISPVSPLYTPLYQSPTFLDTTLSTGYNYHSSLFLDSRSDRSSILYDRYKDPTSSMYDSRRDTTLSSYDSYKDPTSFFYDPSKDQRSLLYKYDISKDPHSLLYKAATLHPYESSLLKVEPVKIEPIRFTSIFEEQNRFAPLHTLQAPNIMIQPAPVPSETAVLEANKPKAPEKEPNPLVDYTRIGLFSGWEAFARRPTPGLFDGWEAFAMRPVIGLFDGWYAFALSIGADLYVGIPLQELKPMATDGGSAAAGGGGWDGNSTISAKPTFGIKINRILEELELLKNIYRPEFDGDILVFPSFPTLKQPHNLGKAGEGYQWHHIVTQCDANVERFGEEAIHNTLNVVRIPREMHLRISGYYASIQSYSEGMRVRDWLKPKSYREQYEFGINELKKQGWKP